ncbi:MAG: DNA glycosylase AlkZ-like family protein, partial [Gemmatimonadaceae bacterium]
MIPEQIARQRLVRQHLVSPTFTDPVDVVRTLGAVQAQEYPGAKWAIGLRTVGVTDADVERAVAAGAIIRTHVLRPTWHFVAPEDLRWMLALTAPRVSAAMGYYNRLLGLDAKVFRKSNAALTRTLRDGRQLTRRELVAALTRAGVKVPTGQH